MKKQLLTLMIASISLIGYAQVGIGTSTPETTLDIVATNTTVVPVGTDTAGILTSADGITVPSVTDASTTAINGVNDGQLVYDTTQKAFYYFNSATSAWTAVKSDATPGPTFRTTTSFAISDADIGNYIIWEGTSGGAFDLDSLTLTEGAILIIIDNGTGAFGMTSVLGNIASNVNPTQAAQGTTQQWICDGSTWYNFGI
jgi:hypothetical protein